MKNCCFVLFCLEHSMNVSLSMCKVGTTKGEKSETVYKIRELSVKQVVFNLST